RNEPLVRKVLFFALELGETIGARRTTREVRFDLACLGMHLAAEQPVQHEIRQAGLGALAFDPHVLVRRHGIVSRSDNCAILRNSSMRLPIVRRETPTTSAISSWLIWSMK